MPLLSSAKKALRSSRSKEQRNSVQKKKLHDIIREVDEKNINTVYKAIDKAAKNGLIHKNKAAHMKSAVAKKIGKTPVNNDESKRPNVKSRSKSKTDK